MSMVKPDPEILKAIEVKAEDNFFPKDIVKELTELVLSSQVRKISYRVEEFPLAIQQAGKFVESVVSKSRINKAVLKRYVPGESSGAFDFHIDPPEYEGHLFLCSLTGKATLFISTSEHGIVQLDCSPNTFVAIPVSLPHKVSPPDPKYGVRALLFLGNSRSDRIVRT